MVFPRGNEEKYKIYISIAGLETENRNGDSYTQIDVYGTVLFKNKCIFDL
jgi:hypothetical protein